MGQDRSSVDIPGRHFGDGVMPLFDHFHPPLHPHHHWESFHSNWATRIADSIAAVLPPDYQVEEHIHLGPSIEIDVAALEGTGTSEGGTSSGPALATRAAPAYAPPVPDGTMPAAFLDTFEIRVFSTPAGLTLVAVVELISPGNKDRPGQRRAFAAKCASYLAQGVSLIMVDVVTTYHTNLHNDLMQLMDAGGNLTFPPEVNLYAASYRPVRRRERDEIDLWRRRLAVGAPLPTLPLHLPGDMFLAVDFEATYQEACRRRRLA
jgi:hypothetical protein